MRRVIALLLVVGLPLMLSFVDQLLCRYDDSCEAGPGLMFLPVVAGIYVIAVLLIFIPSLVCGTKAGRTLSALSISIVIAVLLGQVVYDAEVDSSKVLWSLFMFVFISVPAITGLLVWPKRDRKGVLIPLPPTPPGMRVRTGRLPRTSDRSRTSQPMG